MFFASDHHFGHENILKFTRNDGSLLRNFNYVEEMNEHIIERHNSVVTPQDKVYLLGDFAFNIRTFSEILPRLNGKLRLILGNHDPVDLHKHPVSRRFQKVLSSYQFKNEGMHIIATHIPVFLNPQDKRTSFNVHGHVHSNTLPDKRYFNVSMENINYTPVHLDEVIKRFR